MSSSENGIYGWIHVVASYEQKTHVITSTKTGDTREVPILKDVYEILQRHGQREGFVFGDGKTPVPTAHWARDLKAACKKLGLKAITFHQLRHSFCSWLDSTGVPRRAVSRIMGHRALATTDRYSHMNQDMVGSAFGRVPVEVLSLAQT